MNIIKAKVHKDRNFQQSSRKLCQGGVESGWRVSVSKVITADISANIIRSKERTCQRLLRTEEQFTRTKGDKHDCW